jgi:acetyl esterase/lipase
VVLNFRSSARTRNTTDGYDRPTAASLVNGCDFEQGAIQQTLPKKESHQSDTECLNLNIAVPEGTTSASKLPVFLFIHGGGLNLGANSWPQFDWTRVINLSVEKGVPILAVGPKYVTVLKRTPEERLT